LPEPTSARPAAALAKRLVRRLTQWEIDPIVRQLNRLHEVVVDALEEADRPTSAGAPGNAPTRSVGARPATPAREEPAGRVP
jgi:hypothetical protein